MIAVTSSFVHSVDFSIVIVMMVNYVISVAALIVYNTAVQNIIVTLQLWSICRHVCHQRPGEWMLVGGIDSH